MSEKTHSFASVTVVFNGAEVLSRHLDALKGQTHKIDEIIVINNASTDATMDLLATTYPEITLLNLPENVGVGGGFATGLQYAALTRKHDWVWLFDQDSVPSGDSLEQLFNGLRYLDDADNAAILGPVCIHPETGMTSPGHIVREGRFVAVPPNPAKPVTLVDSVISSGSLIRRQAVEAKGVPRADLFMDFVDYEYCLRLRRHGFDIAVVRDSILHHVLGEPYKIDFMGRTKYWTDHAPWREYYMVRNEIFTVWKYFPKPNAKLSTLYRLARHAVEILLLGKRKLACLIMMWRGLLDGRAQRLGIRFVPDSDLRAFASSGDAETPSVAFAKSSGDRA